MPEPHQQSLARQFAEGDMAAAQHTIDIHQSDITRLVVRMLGWQHPEAVDDLVQETFLRALESRQRFNGQSTLATWLTRIAVNQCRAYLRKHRRRHLLLSWWKGQQPNRTAPAADTHSQQDETNQHVQRAIAELSATHREVIVLHYLEHQSIDHIAETLGISPGATTTRLSRARDALRTLLDPALIDPS
ncbi:RNA polymerase sigma factor [Aeoliella mucimassa]|uniref:RNA polymerase sigma factor n=1 Tax=Aeoliella mucimassa TaxID=2527972 RepID=A0A518AI23_9BACT|nr:RNA polymerase sigma factor [Aeoliella mucimassa]QDU54377.1 ECF RNA polymerase sigma factor SigW [Aeoliella mucimassa]